MDKDEKAARINANATIIAALIGCIGVISSTIIGMSNYGLDKLNKTLIQENIELSQQNDNWGSTYNNLKDKFDELEAKNNVLNNEINDLKDTLENRFVDSEYVPVPNVINLPQEEAVKILEKLNLDYEVWVNEEDIGDSYYVVDQSIPADSMLKPKTRIKLQLVAY